MTKILVFIIGALLTNYGFSTDTSATSISVEMPNGKTEVAASSNVELTRCQKCRTCICKCVEPKKVVKAITYRLFAACGTAGATYFFFNGDVSKTLQLTGALSVISTVLYYSYDRLWECCTQRIINCRQRK